MPCLVGMPANDQSVALSHAVQLLFSRGAEFVFKLLFVIVELFFEEGGVA